MNKRHRWTAQETRDVLASKEEPIILAARYGVTEGTVLSKIWYEKNRRKPLTQPR